MSDTAEIERKFLESGFGDPVDVHDNEHGNNYKGMEVPTHAAINAPLNQDVHTISVPVEDDDSTVVPVYMAPGYQEKRKADRYDPAEYEGDQADNAPDGGYERPDTAHEDYLQSREDINDAVELTKAEIAEELVKQAELKKSLDEIDEYDYPQQISDDSATDTSTKNSTLNISSNKRIASKVSAKHPKKGSTVETGIPTDFNRLRKLGASVIRQV